MATVKTFVMDVTKDDSFVQAFTARQGDQGDILEFNLYDNGLPISITTVSSAMLVMQTPLNHYIEQPMTVTLDPKEPTGIVCRTAVTSNFNAEAGMAKRMYVKLVMKDTNVIKSSPDLIYYVLPAADLFGGAANDYISKVEQVIQQVNELYAQYKKDLKEVYDTTTAELKAAFDKSVKELNDSVKTFTDNLNAQLQALTTKVNNIEAKTLEIDTELEALRKKMAEIVAQGAITQSQADARYMKKIQTPVVAQDWDTLRDIGTYSVESAKGANMPPVAGTIWGTLLVQGIADNHFQRTQLVISATSMWFRRQSGATTWGEWVDVSKGVDDTIAFTLKGTTPNTVNNVYQIGFYYVQGNNLPTDIPDLSAETGEKDGFLMVYRREHSTYVTKTMQTLFFPDLGKVFMRLQRGSVAKAEVGTKQLEWYEWQQIAGTPPVATVEDIIIGEREDVMITPKALKEATESTVPFAEYFGTGKQTENVTGTRDVSFAIGASLGVSPNGEGKRPYTINSDGTLTLTRPAKLKITMTHKVVSGTATPSPYHYVYITDVTQLPSGFSGDDVEIASTGSTLATNGTLNYNWINSGTRVWDLPVGFVIKPSVRLQDANKQLRWIQCLGMTIEEVPTPNTTGLNISALADNPVVRLEDLQKALEDAKPKKYETVVNNVNADWATSKVIYQREGSLVTAILAIKPSESGNGQWKTISQFPQGYRPVSLAYVSAKLVQNSVVALGGMVYANANGFASILDDGSKKYTYIGTITYRTNEPEPTNDMVNDFTVL